MKSNIFLKLIFLFTSIALCYSSFMIYESYVLQKKLLIDFNNGKTETNLEDLQKMNTDYPNLSVTALPIKGMISRYYFVKEDFKSAFKVLDSARNISPYIRFTDALYSDYFFAIKEVDSAIYYSKIAWEGLPNNSRHFTLYMKALAAEGKIEEILKSFELVKNNGQLEFWRVFFATMVQFRDEVKLDKYLNEAEQVFNDNDEINYLVNLLRFGKENTDDMKIKLENAEKNFKEGNFKESIKLYTEIKENYLLDNFDITSNIALSYYSLKNFDDALTYIDQAIELNKNSPKMYFFKGLVLNALNRKNEESCYYIKKSAQMGYNRRQVELALKKVKC